MTESNRTPLFSVVTINRNNARGLRATLEATFAQSCRDCEQIVIDGASTDDSTAVVAEFSDRIAYSVSEPDSGIYNAMNKGIRAARGKYLVFMNSGDHFWSPYVLEAFEDDARAGDADLLYGDYVLDDACGGSNIIPQPETLRVDHYNPPVTWGICHQSIFYRDELVRKLGGYDESYRIAADWKFTLRALIEFSATQRHLPVPVPFYDYHGISSVESNREKATREALRACTEVIPPSTWEAMRRAADAEVERRRRAERRAAPPLKARLLDFAWKKAKSLSMAYLDWREGK